MLPCETKSCAYRRSITGDRHSSCVRYFTPTEIKPILIRVTELPEHALQWFIFPFNFDPVWGPDECLGFSETVDPDNLKVFSPDEHMIAMLGKRILQ